MTRHTRRQFVRGTGAASVAGLTAMAGCLGGDSAGDTLGLYSWGGSTQEALMEHVAEPFEEEYDVEVEETSFDNQDSMLSNVRTSPAGSYDIIMPSAERTYEAVQQDLVEPIRTGDIGTWDNLFPVFQDLEIDPGGDVHVAPLYYGTIGMVYNTDYVDTSSPPSWELLWDEAYEDRITVQDLAMLRVFTTALHLGLDPNTLEANGSYEDGVEQVYDAMAEQHELVRTYWASGQEQVTQYQEESSYVGTGWGGRILALQDEGYDQLEYAIPEEGAKGWADMLAIAKGSENRELAEQFIEFAYRDEIIQNLAPEIGYPPATSVTTDEIEALPDFDPTGGEGLLFEDPEFVDEHESDWIDTFERIKMGEY